MNKIIKFKFFFLIFIILMIIKRKMSISLESAIRTCKVDTGYANKVESQRILDRNTMICPIWNGLDSAGRYVSRDSFYTKSAGCNSAEDRVVVENSQRPQYAEYVNLAANGINGDIYGSNGGSREEYGNTMAWNIVGETGNVFAAPVNRQQCLDNMSKECYNEVANVGGSFGQQLSSNVYPGCGYFPYNTAMAQEQSQTMAQNQENFRRQGALENGYIGNDFRRTAGM